MSYSIGLRNGRDIGYGVPAKCDHPDCAEEIDRGMGWQCGGGHGADNECGLFFCSKHLHKHSCIDYLSGSLDPSADIPLWVWWKMNAHSWSKWRSELNDSERQELQLIADDYKPSASILRAIKSDKRGET